MEALFYFTNSSFDGKRSVTNPVTNPKFDIINDSAEFDFWKEPADLNLTFAQAYRLRNNWKEND